MRRLGWLVLGLALISPASCDDGGVGPGEGGGGTGAGGNGGGWKPERYCPGGPGCEAGPDGVLKAGAAKRDVTPTAWEEVLPDYLSSHGDDCRNGQTDCENLIDLAFKDCGTDKLCPRDEGYVAADADGTERDGVKDFFRDCGYDRLCPGDAGYAAPDADGSEGNGQYDGYWLAGYQNNRPMLGSADPIWARAFALQNGDVTVAWVVIDSVGFFYNNLDCPPELAECVGRAGVRQRVAALRPDLSVDLVVAGSTHSHEAPDTMGQWGFADEFGAAGVPTKRGVNDQWLFDVVIERAAEAVIEALEGLKPAKAYGAAVRTGYDGWATDHRDPIVHDDTLVALRFADATSDETIATVVNWGSHPESMADMNNLNSSEFPHYLRLGVEEGLPAAGAFPALPGQGGICIYVQGAVGGLIGPLRTTITARDGTVTASYTIAKSQANGENLAQKALETLATAPEITDPRLSFASQRIRLPVENIFFRVAAVAFNLFNRPIFDFDRTQADSDTNKPHLETEVAILRLGDVGFVTTPGEIFPEMIVGFDETWRFGKPWAKDDNPLPPDQSAIPEGPFLKEIVGGRVTVIAGLTFDETGYQVPPYDFVVHPDAAYIDQAEGDHYEETNSLGPETIPLLFATWTKLAGYLPE